MNFIGQVLYLLTCKDKWLYEALVPKAGVVRRAWRNAKLQRFYNSYHRREMSWKGEKA